MRLTGSMVSGHQVLNVKEISEIFHTHRSTIYRMIREGKIPSFRVGTEWRFRKDEIERWVAAGRP